MYLGFKYNKNLLHLKTLFEHTRLFYIVDFFFDLNFSFLEDVSPSLYCNFFKKVESSSFIEFTSDKLDLHDQISASSEIRKNLPKSNLLLWKIDSNRSNKSIQYVYF